uniref:Sc:d0202 n=1 Tax=Fundulus heteroclitus TaxID=8078 RepID=A0A3Q2NPD4_FUNHE
SLLRSNKYWIRTCLNISLINCFLTVDFFYLIMSTASMLLYFHVAGEDASCAVELIPPRVVVKHGDPVSVNCSTSASDVAGVGWEASQGGTGIREQRSVMWTVESLIQWDISPKCFLTDIHGKQCLTKLDLVIYKTISISSSADLNEGIRENVEYNFTCSILNIAPVQNLMIRWYGGDALIQPNTLQSEQKTPTNQTSVHSFTPTRQHDGTTIRCEAHMDLGPEGPKFNASSQELNIKVLPRSFISCSNLGNTNCLHTPPLYSLFITICRGSATTQTRTINNLVCREDQKWGANISVDPTHLGHHLPV